MRHTLAQIHQSGATDGQVPVWDDAAGLWVPGAGGSTGSAAAVYMPLTTVVGGVPELVWGADDSLIPTEVPL